MDCFKTRKKFLWRKSLVGFALSALLLPGAASALGMGNIQVKSTLQQPLQAQIELLDIDPQQLDYVRVNLADRALFTRMGLQRTELLEQLKFNVQKLKDGRYVIVVSTEKPVAEPFLNFLIDVDWGTGRSFREFTVLLDPPVFQSGSATAPVVAPEVVPSRVVTTPPPAADVAPSAPAAAEPVASSPVVAVAPTSAQTAAASGAGQFRLQKGPVKKGQMLWNIANDARPSDVSVNQMMLALLKENPDAFFGDNVNMLKEGSILRLSSEDAVRMFGSREAMLEIAKQNKTWLEYRRQLQANSAVASGSASGKLLGDQSGSGQGTGAAPVQQKRLELVAPEGDDASRAAVASEIQHLEKQINELTNQLAMSRESVTAAKEENKELRTRLDALKEQMTAMQSLIALKDQELEMLRAQPAPDAQAGDPLLSLDTPQQDQPLSDKAANEKVAEPSIWRDPLVLATLGGVVFLVMLLAWMLGRNRKREQSLDDFDKQVAKLASDEQDSDFRPQDSKFVPEGALTEVAQDSELEHSTIAASNAADSEPLGDFAQGKMVEVGEVKTSAVDALTEADLYIAYEKYDKAKEVLNAALEREPDALTLRLKRLEVLALLRNADAFEEEAEEMFAALGGNEHHPMWQAVLEYSRHLHSSNPLFDDHESEPSQQRSQFVDPAMALVDHHSQADSHIADLSLGDLRDKGDVAVLQEEDSVALLSELESIASALDEVLQEERSTGYIPVDMVSPGSATTQFPVEAFEQPVSEPVAQESETPAASDYEELEWRPDVVTELVPGQPQSEVAQARDEDFRAIREALEEVGLDDEPHRKTGVAELQDSDNLEPLKQDVDSVYLLDDEVGSKLDLARAYLEMDEDKRAEDLLRAVLEDGTEKQQQEATDLLQLIGKGSQHS